MDDDDIIGDDDSFSVNYSVIANDTKMSTLARTLANSIISSGYMSVGSFFKQLADVDVQMLVDMVEESSHDVDDEGSPATKELALISMMLYQAEGGMDINIDVLQRLVYTLNLFIVITSLQRKGFVEVFYENYSFDEDMSMEVIARRLDTDEDE